MIPAISIQVNCVSLLCVCVKSLRQCHELFVTLKFVPFEHDKKFIDQ